MWVILLDCSGSMGEPFRGRSGFAGRSVPARAEVKPEAAKLALLERLPGLGAARIALFAFAGRPSFVLDGRADEHGRIRHALDGLTAAGGTNIAAALDAARGPTSASWRRSGPPCGPTGWSPSGPMTSSTTTNSITT
jgi:hypothetical protein